MYGVTKVCESKDLEPIHGPHPCRDKPNTKEQKVKKRETRDTENEAKGGTGL